MAIPEPHEFARILPQLPVRVCKEVQFCAQHACANKFLPAANPTQSKQESNISCNSASTVQQPDSHVPTTWIWSPQLCFCTLEPCTHFLPCKYLEFKWQKYIQGAKHLAGKALSQKHKRIQQWANRDGLPCLPLQPCHCKPPRSKVSHCVASAQKAHADLNRVPQLPLLHSLPGQHRWTFVESYGERKTISGPGCRRLAKYCPKHGDVVWCSMNANCQELTTDRQKYQNNRINM